MGSRIIDFGWKGQRIDRGEEMGRFIGSIRWGIRGFETNGTNRSLPSVPSCVLGASRFIEEGQGEGHEID